MILYRSGAHPGGGWARAWEGAGLVPSLPWKPGLPPGVLLTTSGGHCLLSSPSARVSSPEEVSELV